MEADGIQSLREGKVSLPYSFNVVGVADITGTLPEGCVCVVRGGNTLGRSVATDADNEDQILLYRSPGCLSG